MNLRSLAALFEQQKSSGKRYLEFLRVLDLSVGLYVLPAGTVDPQQPHTEDEVYYVLRGKARVQVANEHRDVATGDVIYVPKTVPHRFHDIAEELALLVFFAPAEGTAR